MHPLQKLHAVVIMISTASLISLFCSFEASSPDAVRSAFCLLTCRVKDMTFEQEVQHWVNVAQAEDDAMQQQQQHQKKQS
jgi:hypothetical protein